MTMTRLIRSELRKLTSTKMPFAFLGVLVVLAGLNAFAVIAGTDADGSKAFVVTAADQQSLIAFAANAFMGAGLFGAIAVAREYGHHTIVPTFLASPRRYRAVLAQLAAVAGVGAVLSVVGAGLTVTAVALALRTTDYGFLVSAGDVVRVIAASGFAGAAGAILGAGIGAVVRNVGSAVTSTVLVLIIAPPLVVQLVSGSGSWMPGHPRQRRVRDRHRRRSTRSTPCARCVGDHPCDGRADRRPTTRRDLTMNWSSLNGGSDGSPGDDVVPCAAFLAAHTLGVAERFVWFTAREQS